MNRSSFQINFQTAILSIVFCFCFAHSSVGQIPFYIPTSGLKAWYPFSGNANDSSGYAAHGIPYGSIIYGVDRHGVPNSCYVGNGYTGVDIPYSNLPIGNSARSVSAWYKMKLPYLGGPRILVDWGNNIALGERFGLLINDLTIGLEYRNGAVTTNYSVDSAWHNLIITYPTSGSGSSSVIVYCDGLPQVTTTISPVASFNTDTGNIHAIGTLYLAPGYLYSWDGSIDDVAIWDRAISPCEAWIIAHDGLQALAGTITGGNTLCAGATMSLTDTASGGTWSSSNPTIATVGSSSGIVTGLTSGTVIISYSVTNTCGTATDTQAIVVIALPNAGTIGGPTNVCAGSAISLTNAVTGGTWSSSSPLVATVGAASGIVTGLTVGTTIITYSITNSCGNAIDTQAIVIDPAPYAGNISGSGRVCEGMTIILTNAVTGGTWSSSSSTIATVGSSSGIVTGLTPGTTVISYSVTNSCGMAVDTQAIVVVPLPNAGVITGPAGLCLTSAPVTLTNTVAGGTWSSNSTSVATINAVSGLVGVLAVGSVVISYTVPPDIFGCVNSATLTLTVFSGIAVNGTITPIICNGDTNGGVSVVAVNGSGSYQYTWSDGSTASAVNGLGSGIYTVIATDLITGCTDTQSFSIVTPDQIRVESTIQNELCNSGSGKIDLVNVRGGVAPFTYLWSTGATTTSIAGLGAGVYTVAVTDINLCTQHIVFNVGSDSCNDINIHDVITPNGDDKNEVWVIEGIQKYAGNTVQLFDKWGDMVFNAENYNNDWGGGRLPDGTYFYLIKLNSSSLSAEKNVIKGSLLIKR